LVASSVVVIDQVSKVLATHGGSSIVLPERNPAYAFGILRGPAPLLVVGAFLVLAAFLVVADALVTRLGISIYLPALIAGGTIGNTLDRIRFGAARDFLVVPGAIVNFADIAVAVGIVGIAIGVAARLPRLRTELTTAAR
jgi:lipoprotein signal peptidase